MSAVAAAAAPHWACAAPLAQGGAPEIPLVRLFLALTVGIALALGAALWLKHRLATARATALKTPFSILLRAPPRRITVIESRRLSASADVCLLDCAEKRYLVVVSTGAIVVLNASATPATPDPGP